MPQCGSRQKPNTYTDSQPNLRLEYLGSGNLVRDYFDFLNFMFDIGIIFFNSTQTTKLSVSFERRLTTKMMSE